MSLPVTIRGVEYPSHEAAARALGLTSSTISKARRKGTLHRVGTGRTGAEAMPVRIHGRDYPSAKAAAAALGVTPSCVFHALSLGDPDRIGRRTLVRNNAQPVRIGNLDFPSKRAAAIALGFKPEYVARAIKLRRASAWQRILSAAMVEEARRARSAARSKVAAGLADGGYA